MDRDIRTVDDVLKLLDALFTPAADRWTADAASWWDGFYADRSRPVPFFVAKPDENLVSYLERGLITPGRALDLGCGPGRNALHLATAGFEVDAVDLSPTAVAWAQERARKEGVEVRFLCGDAFALADAELRGPYDLIYDSGCFHHLPPHRRISYLALLQRALAPGGHFALTCFAVGAMGSELDDIDFYREKGLKGGLAYTPDSLRRIFSDLEPDLESDLEPDLESDLEPDLEDDLEPDLESDLEDDLEPDLEDDLEPDLASDLEEIELRRMHDEPPASPHFGEPFLWTALFRRNGRSRPSHDA